MNKLLFAILLLVYVVLYFVKSAGMYWPVVSAYAADFLCLPIVLSITRFIMIKTGMVGLYFELSIAKILVATAMFAVVFEFILPRWSNEYHSDYLDIAAYFLGGFLYYGFRRVNFKNALMRLSVNNWLILFTAALTPYFGFAQGQNWDDLSAKEKAELARQEQMEASRDAQFLDLMDEGHALFEARKYLQSIRKYEKAEELRPLNVYPPVIIRDIELSMKDTLEVLREREKQEEKEQQKQPLQPEKPLPDREEEMAEFREKEIERQQKADKWEENQRRQLARERALKKEEDQQSRELTDQKGRDVSKTSMEEFQRDLADQYSTGVTQRTYEEGNRKITERIVVKGNIGNEYKKVEHAWGGKFYFKNGLPISEETWNQEASQ